MDEILATLTERIKGIESTLASHGRALNDQNNMMLDTRKVLIELNAKFQIPGTSPWCVEHMRRIEKLTEEVEKVKSWMYKAIGVTSVLFIVINVGITVAIKMWKP